MCVPPGCRFQGSILMRAFRAQSSWASCLCIIWLLVLKATSCYVWLLGGEMLSWASAIIYPQSSRVVMFSWQWAAALHQLACKSGVCGCGCQHCLISCRHCNNLLLSDWFLHIATHIAAASGVASVYLGWSSAGGQRGRKCSSCRHVRVFRIRAFPSYPRAGFVQ